MELFLDFIATPVGTFVVGIVVLIMASVKKILDRQILNQKHYQKLYSTLHLVEYSIGAIAVYLLYAKDIKVNLYYVFFLASFEFAYLYVISRLVKDNVSIVSSVGAIATVLALLFLKQQFLLMAVILLATIVTYAVLLIIKKPNKFLFLSFLIIMLNLAFVIGEEFFWLIVREDGVIAYSLLAGYLLFVILNSIIRKENMINFKLLAQPLSMIRLIIGSISITLVLIIYNRSVIEIYLIIITFRALTTLLMEQKQDKSPLRQTIKLAVIILVISIGGYFLKDWLKS